MAASFISGTISGLFSGMAFNQTERNAAKATQSLFTKVGAWGARWGSNGFEEITNYYSCIFHYGSQEIILLVQNFLKITVTQGLFHELLKQ